MDRRVFLKTMAASGASLALFGSRSWFADQGTTLQSWPEVEAVLYSHTSCHHNGYVMEYCVDSSPASLAAYTALGQDSNFLSTAA